MNVPIYDGNPLWNPNAVPFGFYSNNTDFQTDCVKVAEFCAIRLGYPLVDIELQSSSFFTAFEEATTVYGNELYAYLVRDNLLSLEGLQINDFQYLNGSIITPNFAPIARLSQMYGEEAGTGGNVTWYTGEIPLTASVQDYDLKEWAVDQGITGSIEIKRVFFQDPIPASAQYLNPYSNFGFGGAAAAGVTGLGGFGGGGMGFLMMPLSFDMQVIQAIEMNNEVRLSNYSFEMHNNVLRIFPMPGPYTRDNEVESVDVGKIWFEYIKVQEQIDSSVQLTNTQVSNPSNVPYTNPDYNLINSIGRQWIFEYTLALSKEILGYVRGKYGTIPIPNSDITLNQSDLLSSATADKNLLLDRLRGYFDETSRSSLLARRAAERESKDKELEGVPTFIYIG
jgi:hypothetical protein